MPDAPPPPRYAAAPPDPKTAYAPVSGLAIAAAAVALVFVGAIVILGAFAWKDGKPLSEWEVLLGLAAVGVILAFVARRSIRASEGTRTGEVFANAAWWTCVVGGLVYAAYLGAVTWAVRAEAEAQFDVWAKAVSESAEADAAAGDAAAVNKAEQALAAGFYSTVPPGERANIARDNTDALHATFRTPLGEYRRLPFVVQATRNAGRAKVTSEGVVAGSTDPQTGDTRFQVAALLTTPEGEFHTVVPLLGVSGSSKGKAAGRQWSIEPTFARQLQSPNGMVSNRTRYGWLMTRVEETAQATAAHFLQTAANNPARVADAGSAPPPDGLGQPLAFAAFAEGRIPPSAADDIAATAVPRAAVAGSPTALFPPSAAYTARLAGDFLVQEDGKPASDALRDKFLFCWRGVAGGRIVPGGVITQNQADTRPTVRTAPDRVEVRIPLEFKTQASYTKAKKAARGRLVLVCTDPAVLSELNTARDAGGKVTLAPPDDLAAFAPRWTVVRFETDLLEVEPPADAGAGGPGGPPGG